MFLSLDTCGLDFSIALLKEGLVVAEYLCKDEQSQSEKLIIEIEKILERSAITYDHLSGIILTKGPGSFNGIRIGYSTASGLVIGKKLPLFTVNSLVTLFYQGLLSNLWAFPSSIGFLLDSEEALLQNFYSEKDLTLEPEKVSIKALPKASHIFSLKHFALEGAKVSKAAAAGLAFFAGASSKLDLLYAKEPSIDLKK